MNLKQPLFFQKNRVRRIYTGGAQFAEFCGDNSTEGYFPEEWICSCVKALNEGSTDEFEGISRLESGELWSDLLMQYPTELLGEGRTDLGVLVKFLDSSIRLPVQVHPDKEFSRKYFHSEYGKTESWVILGTGKDACIYFGFNDCYSAEEFRSAFDEENDSHLLSMLNKIPVKVGDVFLIHGKAIHAIGQNCLLLEVQEPTDFTIQPEIRCGEYVLNDNEKYLGLSPEDAFRCFDLELSSLEKSLASAKRNPTQCGDYESLISYEDTPCFSVNRYTVTDAPVSLPAPAIYVVTAGEGIVHCGEFERKLHRGEYFFAPAQINGELTVSGTGLQIVQCCLPQK